MSTTTGAWQHTAYFCLFQAGYCRRRAHRPRKQQAAHVFSCCPICCISSIVMTLFKILPFDFAQVAFSNWPFKFLGFSPALAMPAAPVPHPLQETAGPLSCFFHKAMTVWTCPGTGLPGHRASLSVHQWITAQARQGQAGGD